MINCKTQYGTWKSNSQDIHIIEPKMYGKRIVVDSPKIEDKHHLGSMLYSWTALANNIKFYDTCGKYTGFRLKSLKQ